MGEKGSKKDKNKAEKQKQTQVEKKKEQQKAKLPAKKPWFGSNIRALFGNGERFFVSLWFDKAALYAVLSNKISTQILLMPIGW